MIDIIDIVSRQGADSDKLFGCFSSPEYPELAPDDILFAFCSGQGSQGEKANYIITYIGAVYRVSVFEFGVDEFMERVCPFLKDWDYDTMPWCWLGVWGTHTLYMHASMAEEFASAVKDFNSSDMYKKWLEVAVGMVGRMIKDINPIKKRLMFDNTDINRFIEAQEVPYFCGYRQALEEIKNGRKINHWIWYVFPQLRCLGRSSRAHYYGIANRNEAQRYLEHPVLGARIREITEALLEHKDKSALSIFGDIDAIKVRSCMTMFDFLSPDDIFGEVLRSFYNEERCEITLKVMQQ